MKISIYKKTSIPFKVIIPGLVGLFTLAIKRGIQPSLLPPQRSESGISPNEFLFTSTPPADPINQFKWFLEPVYEASKSIGETLLESYNNYFTFMLMMLLVNMIIHGPAFLKGLLAGQRNQKKSSLSQHTVDEISPILKSLLKALITYSLQGVR